MNLTIGIVDDQQLFLEGFSTLLGNLNFKVVLEASNGKEAMHKLECLPRPPHIILVDIEMPVMDGLATVQSISAQFPTVKTVAMSIDEDERSISKLLNAGCCAYISKTIDPYQLRKTLIKIAALP